MAKILNLILLTIGGFFISFTWLTYYKQALWLRYVLSLLFCVILFAALWVLSEKTNKKINKKRISKNETEAKKLHLITSIDFSNFEEVFEKKGYEIVKKFNNGFVAKLMQTTMVIFNFKFTPLSNQDVVNASKQANSQNCDKLLIFCITYDVQSKDICEVVTPNCTLLDYASTIKFLEENEVKITPTPVEKKYKSKSKLLYFAFNRNRFGYFFWSAILMAILSKFSYFTAYNLVIASISFVLSLYCLFNKRYNVPTKAYEI